MTETVRQRCLEPFFSTKGKEGTGLGLAMVHGIIGRHNGTIEIESEPGKGTTFRIRLPVKRSQQPKNEKRGVKEAVSHRRHVLLVEDEPPVRQMLSTYLSTESDSL